MDQLSIFKARSFWLIIAAVILPVLQTKGLFVGMDQAGFVDLIMKWLPYALMVWAYIERLLGKKKLVLTVKK